MMQYVLGRLLTRLSLVLLWGNDKKSHKLYVPYAGAAAACRCATAVSQLPNAGYKLSKVDFLSMFIYANGRQKYYSISFEKWSRLCLTCLMPH